MADAARGKSRAGLDPIQILMEASEVAADHPLDLDDLLQALADLVRKVVDYQLFAVMLTEPDQTLRIRHSIGYRPELVRTLRVRQGDGITGNAAQTRKTIVVDDVRQDPRYLMAIDAVRSEIAVPLVARRKLVGVIDLQSPKVGAFGDEERTVLELIASRFSLAIEAAQLYQATVRQNATLKLLAGIAQEFSQILNLDELLKEISSRVRELVRYDAFSIYLLKTETETLEHYFGVRFDQRVQWQSMRLGEGLTGHAALTRKPVLVRDTTQDERYVPAVEGIRSEVAVPLLLKDELIGVVDLESDRVAAFKESHVQTLTMLAPQIASAIENARLYEQVARGRKRLQRDLTAARQLQQALLPQRAPRFEGIEVAARNVPAREVSGDLYDFHAFPGECFGVFNGDVAGKGAPAALLASLAAGLLRNLAPQHHEPHDLLHQLNQALLARKIEARYLAGLYAHWRPDERELHIANAGQPRPIICRGGRAEALDVGGTPLGMMEGGSYDEVKLRMEPGDFFVTASDGLHETEDPEGIAYGEERLVRLAEESSGASADELLDAIFADAQSFSQRATPADDRTVVVLRVT